MEAAVQDAAVDLVIVSREYGAGGSEFATGLAKRLGWGLLDGELVKQVADRLHLHAGTVQQRDEQTPGWLTRIAFTLMISPESPMHVESSEVLSPDCVAHAAHAAMVEAAAHPPMVIVGHGAQCIFRDRPGTVIVRLTGSIKSRIPRIVARDGVSEHDAVAHAHRIDAQRQAYVQRYYHHFWGDPLLFDAQFNTERVSIEEVVSLVASLVSARGATLQAHAVTA
jgi:cytidylate kinase